jgi:hypothetical protein
MSQSISTTDCSRREFLIRSGVTAGCLALGTRARGDEFVVPPRHDGPRPRIAGIYTIHRERAHAYHILESHMGPFLFRGKLTDPGVDVVSWYADQFPDGDMTREAAARLNVPLLDSIEEALTLGGDGLGVDGVLLIGEHGDYPRSELGQVMYPRKEFFDRIVAVMDRSKKYVPIFNDKHLSYRWDWAKEMYDVARDRGIPFMAGSSVPLAQRIPDIEIPADARITEAVSIHGGPLESYDFHGIEVLQSLVEHRAGGETGISSVQVLEGEAMLRAGEAGQWSLELGRAAMQAELGDEFTEFQADGPLRIKHGLLLTYRDGFKGTVLAAGASAVRWNFACQIAGEPAPQALRFYPGPWGNRNLFRALSHAIQELFINRESPYPVERTLLATGVLDAAMRSHQQGGAVIETPELEFSYAAKNFDHLRENGESWKILTDKTPQPPKFEPGDIETLKRNP